MTSGEAARTISTGETARATTASEARDASARARSAAADEALGLAPGGRPGLPLGKALGGLVLWLGAEGGIVWVLTRLLPPWGPIPPAEGAAVALAVTAPVAGMLIWASLARRAAAAEARGEALARAQARAAAAAAAAPRPAASEGLSRADLTHAVAHAARDALDGERSAIARRIAELAEAQRRLEDAILRLGAPGAAPPPAPPPIAEAGRAPAAAPPAAPSSILPDAAAPLAAARPSAGPAPDAAAPHPAPSERPSAPPAPPPAPAPAPREEEPGLPLEAPAPPPARAPAAIPASPPPAAAADPQGLLPLAAEAAPADAGRDWGQVALALDFPRDERDDAGWAALAAGARDRPIAELLQAAEDALTLLAQHGVYMEDLSVRLAPPALWTRFAQGERGPALASIGGIDSPEAVESVRRMMKADPVFRDTAMHLMRRFDGVLRRAAAEPRGVDRLLALADSRTGRAFMLVAQAVGAFD
ncbi:MAG: hypothetical protein ACU0DT_13010 [Albimonas sp.]|uniref:hypothetical protein n=1 Tax=Albimonas sp. TaxID=1872425 RepID=UPI0040567B2A